MNELQDFVANILASAGIEGTSEEEGDCWECDEGFIDAAGVWHDWDEDETNDATQNVAAVSPPGALPHLGSITRAPPPPPTINGDLAFLQQGLEYEDEPPPPMVDPDSEEEKPNNKENVPS